MSPLYLNQARGTLPTQRAEAGGEKKAEKGEKEEKNCKFKSVFRRLVSP